MQRKKRWRGELQYIYLSGDSVIFLRKEMSGDEECCTHSVFSFIQLRSKWWRSIVLYSFLPPPSNAVAQARAGQGARGVHASTPDSRDKRRRSHFQREYTEPKEEEPNKMEGDAISSVYILLYAATITTLSLSLCVYSVCVCMYTWWKTEHVPPENRGGLYNTTGRRPIGRIHGSLYKDKPAWWWVPPGLDCILMSSLFLVPSLYYILLPPTTLKSRRKMCNMSTHTHTQKLIIRPQLLFAAHYAMEGCTV